MAAFCACCGAQITLKAERCSLCGAPQHGRMKPEPVPPPEERVPLAAGEPPPLGVPLCRTRR